MLLLFTVQTLSFAQAPQVKFGSVDHNTEPDISYTMLGEYDGSIYVWKEPVVVSNFPLVKEHILKINKETLEETDFEIKFADDRKSNDKMTKRALPGRRFNAATPTDHPILWNGNVYNFFNVEEQFYAVNYGLDGIIKEEPLVLKDIKHYSDLENFVALAKSSADKKYLLLVTVHRTPQDPKDLLNKKPRKKIYGLHVYDKNMNLIASGEEETFASYEEAIVDLDGNAHLLLIENDRKSISEISLFSIAKDKEKHSTKVSITIPASATALYRNFEMHVNSDGDICIATMYFERQNSKEYYSGISYFKVDGFSHREIVSKKIAFDQSLYNKGMKPKSDIWEDGKVDIKYFFFDDNDNLVLSGDFTGNRKLDGLDAATGAAFVMVVDKEGNEKWTSLLLKKQINLTGTGFYMSSYKLFAINGSYHIIFPDNPKNHEEKPTSLEDLNSLFNINKSTLSYVVIDEKGKLSAPKAIVLTYPNNDKPLKALGTMVFDHMVKLNSNQYSGIEIASTGVSGNRKKVILLTFP